VVRWFGGRLLDRRVFMTEPDKRKTIIAIDDNVTQLKVYETCLSSRYDLTLIKSATEAMKIMSKADFDLILLDIEMPDVSGFEFLHEIRKNPRYMIRPVIIVSSHCDKDFLAHAKHSSASEVLTKPVKPDHLFSAIEKALTQPVKPFGF
jgi:CheY-like chemotaxis protein